MIRVEFPGGIFWNRGVDTSLDGRSCVTMLIAVFRSRRPLITAETLPVEPPVRSFIVRCSSISAFT